MAVGYFIRLGDKTSCGGTVVSATSRIIHHGLNLARLGDKVTCGKNEGVFVLLGGISNYTSDGLPCIGTLESSSSCPCKARLFASEFSSSYYPEPPKMASKKTTVNEPEQHAQAAKKQVAEPAPAPAPIKQEEKVPRVPVDAGFCIVDLPANVKDFGDYLFYNPVAGARELYDTLNGSGPIKPASYIEKSAKLIKAMKKLGYVGITLDFANTTNTIYDACTVGRESECKKMTVVEYSKFAGSQTGGLLGGNIGARLSGAACVWGLGLLTSEIGGAGALLCSAVAVTGGLAGGEVLGSVAEDLGSSAGEALYEAFYSE